MRTAVPKPAEGAIALQALEATGVAHLALRNINTLVGRRAARVHLAQLREPRLDGAARWPLLDEPTAALCARRAAAGKRRLPLRSGGRHAVPGHHCVWQVDCTAVPAQDRVLQYPFA